MITRTAHADPYTAQAVDRTLWRMDPPSPNGLRDLLLGALPGALVAMVLLGLLLAFGSVVRDGVRRGEQLRGQMTGAAWRCDTLTTQNQSQSVPCTVGDAPAGAPRAQMPAATEITTTGTLTPATLTESLR